MATLEDRANGIPVFGYFLSHEMAHKVIRRTSPIMTVTIVANGDHESDAVLKPLSTIRGAAV